MAFWRFLDYITEANQNPIGDWYGKQRPDIQVDFDHLIKALSETKDWDEPKPKRRKYKLLTEKHSEMCELKFNATTKRLGVARKHRVVGLWLKEQRTFILFGACQKWKFFTIPIDAFDAALRLKEAFDLGRGGLSEHF
jgi:hypothetical protein